MSIKRVITAVIGLPIVIAVLALSNKYIIDLLLTAVGIIAMHEYIKSAANKEIYVIKWISYLSLFGITCMHLIHQWLYVNILIFSIPILLLILFLHVIVTNMRITFKDVAFTLLGIIYIFSFLAFLAAIFGIGGKLSGKLLIWYVFLSAWGTDTLAYLVGVKFGKTKFSKVSPNKSVEGCVAGTVGAVVFCLLYTLALNTIGGFEISYIAIGISSVLLSLIGQVGDFSASVIKRYFEVKDFSNMFPGHGGMLDRIDSVMFIAPFAYMMFLIIL